MKNEPKSTVMKKLLFAIITVFALACNDRSANDGDNRYDDDKNQSEASDADSLDTDETVTGDTTNAQTPQDTSSVRDDDQRK